MLRTAITIALLTPLLSAALEADAKPAAKPGAKTSAAQAARLGVVRRRGGAAQGNAALTASFNAYCDSLRNKLDKGWSVADGSNKVTVTADVDKDGSVTNLKISSNPTSTAAEQAASDAFNFAQPLTALPAGVQSIKLSLTFDSTADPHGDSSRNIITKVDNIVLPGATTAGSTPAATESGGGN